MYSICDDIPIFNQIKDILRQHYFLLFAISLAHYARHLIGSLKCNLMWWHHFSYQRGKRALQYCRAPNYMVFWELCSALAPAFSCSFSQMREGYSLSHFCINENFDELAINYISYYLLLTSFYFLINKAIILLKILFASNEKICLNN